MAIGIPLSSLDVVVGISGVHYVVQGLRQIDRELDSTSKKRVSAALEMPDMGSSVRALQGNLGTGVAGIRQMTGAVGDLMKAVNQPLVSESSRTQARQTIALAQEAKNAARQADEQAKLGAQEARAATTAYNTALKERIVLEKEEQRAAASMSKTAKLIAEAVPRDYAYYQNYVATRTGSGIRAAGVMASSPGTAAAVKAQEYINTEAMAREQKNLDAIAKLNTQFAQQTAMHAAANAKLAAAPALGPLQATAAAAAANAINLQTAANSANAFSTKMQTAATSAKNFLAQTANFANYRQAFMQLLGAAGSLLGGVVTVGKGLVGLGATALSTAGQVGGLLIQFLKIPAVSGTLTGGLSLIAENFQSIATSVGLVIGSLAALSFKEVISEGMDFEQAMANVKAVAQYSIPKGTPTVVGGVMETQQQANARVSTDEMERLDAITLKLGADTIYSNTEIANIIETLIRGGVSVQEVTNSTVKAVSDLASATKSDTGETAQIIAAIINMFGAGAEELPHYADIIAGAVNTTTMSLADYGSAIRQLGPLSQALNISFEDVTTLLAQVAQKGYFGEMAGTSLRNMLIYLAPRTKPAIEELKSAGLWTGGGEPTRVVSEEDQAAYDRKLATYKTQQANYATRQANYQTQMDNYNAEMAQFNAGKRKTKPTLPTLPTPPTAPTKPKGDVIEGETGHSAFYNEDGSLKSIPEIIKLLQDHTKGMSDMELTEFNDKVFGKRSGAASLLLSKDDADQFQSTKDLISSVKAADVASFRLENAKGKIELLTGSLKSLASVVYLDWLSAPILGLFNKLIPQANTLLDFFGSGKLSKGKQFFDSLGQGITTGDLGGAWIDMMKLLPEGTALNGWTSTLRTLMRVLQLGRDGVITFKQAWQGNWFGAATGNINGIIRALGVLGTYWGTVWRNLISFVKGDIDFHTMRDNIISGLNRMFTEASGLVKEAWPGIWGGIKEAAKELKDLATKVWDEYLHPAVTSLWNWVKDELGKPENQAAIGAQIKSWFTLATGWLGDIGGWISEVTATISKWMADPKHQQEAADAISGMIDSAVGLIKVTKQANIDWNAILNFGKIDDSQINDKLNDGIIGIGTGIADGLDDYNKVWDQRLHPEKYKDQAQSTGQAAADGYATAFDSKRGKVMQSFLLIGELFGATIANAGMWALEKIMKGIVTGIDAITKLFGGKGLSDEDWSRWNTSIEGIFPTATIDPNGDPVTAAALKNLKTPPPQPPKSSDYTHTNDKGFSTVVEFDGNRTYNQVDERFAKPRSDNPITGQEAPDGMLWVFNPESRKWVLADAKSVTAPSVNPVTGQVAPDGFKWIFDGKTRKYVLIPVGDTYVGASLPDALANTVDGMVWVWDPISQAYALVWVGQPPPGKPKLGSGAGFGAAAQASINQGIKVGNAAAAAYSQEPYDDAGNPNPYYVPPGARGLPQDPKDGFFNTGGTPPPTSPNTDTPPPLPSSFDSNTYFYKKSADGKTWQLWIKNGTPGGTKVIGASHDVPVNQPGTTPAGVGTGIGTGAKAITNQMSLVIQAQGLTDDMFLNKVSDKLEALYYKLNGGGATA